MSDPKLRAFETCLEQLKTGAEIDAVLAMYPEWADELRGPLEAAQAAHWLAASIQTPPEAQARSRENFLLATASAQRIESRKRYPSTRRIEPRPHRPFFGLRLALTVLAFLVVVVLGALQTVNTSAGALPGEPLFPVKLASEEVRLWLERDPIHRYNLERSFDTRRFQEIQTLIGRQSEEGQSEPVRISFAGPLTGLQSGDWQINRIRLLLNPETQLVGQLKEGFVAEVTGWLQPDGIVLVERINPRQIPLEGILIQTGEADFQVSGVNFRLLDDTIIEGEILPGSRVAVVLMEAESGDLFARLVRLISLQATNTLEVRSTPRPEEDNSRQDVGQTEDDHAGEDGTQNTPTPKGADKNDDASKTPTPESTSSDDDHEGTSTKTPRPTEGKAGGKSPTPTSDDD